MCCLHPQAREIIERGHHISVYQRDINLPYLFPLMEEVFSNQYYLRYISIEHKL